MSNRVKAKIIPRIVMSITPCDVMLLLPGTDAAGLSYKIYPLLLLLLLLASRSPRQLRYIYPDSAQNNWCARAYWRSIKAAPDCLNKFIEDAILSMRPVLQLSSAIIYYTASFIGDYFRDIITSCSFLSSSSYFSNIYLFHSERFFFSTRPPIQCPSTPVLRVFEFIPRITTV